MSTLIDTLQADRERQLVADLRRTSAYPEYPRRVELRETHISWVFLTEHFAYKLKKPVRFEFLDFSTLEARHAACVDEVRLNRRWSDGVYLGVVPVATGRDGRLAVEGIGPAEEWAVKMRRLDDRLSLDRLLQERRLTSRQRAVLIEFLAGMYQNLPPYSLRAETYRETISRHVEGNLTDLLRAGGLVNSVVVRRVHGSQRRFLRLRRELLDQRVCDGRVVEGHGDLRPEHVYLESPPALVDCIEFNREFRLVDVLDDLSFLAMECERLGAADLGDAILRRYRQIAQDDAPETLVDFFKSYRACVRAKVEVLRSQQQRGLPRQETLDVAREYLAVADRHARRLGPVWLLVLRGLCGSGKSTLARHLAEELYLEVLHTDRLRRELFGRRLDRYSQEARSLVYRELYSKAAERLSEGLSTVIDGTFLRAEQCTQALTLAKARGALPLIVDCECPDSVIRERLAQRRAGEDFDSEADIRVYEAQQQLLEPLSSGLPICRVDTSQSMPAIMQRILEAMQVFQERSGLR